ncbi:hypothetical protein [Patulibacter defluvii]|uniref:hypothetical protein n=1 Tax=Patulibacter defluvii TaxID=3095358 RepID=UPI002A74999E|nr:hypothetical protein [Patulibacter sp. DM4]
MRTLRKLLLLAIVLGAALTGPTTDEARAGLVCELTPQLCNTLSYEYVTTTETGGQPIVRTHKALIDVPTVLNVDDDLAPELTATLLTISGTSATVDIKRNGLGWPNGQKLRTKVEVRLPYTGAKRMAFGYDGRLDTAPTAFKAKLKAPTATDVSVGVTQEGAGAKTAVTGATFTPDGDARKDPTGIEARFSALPAQLDLNAQMTDAPVFQLTAPGRPTLDLKVDSSAGPETQRINAHVEQLPTWTKVTYAPNADGRHVVWDAAQVASRGSFDYTRFVGGVDREHVGIVGEDVPQKLLVDQTGDQLTVDGATAAKKLRAQVDGVQPIFQANGQSVRSLYASLTGPTKKTVARYVGGAEGYRLTPEGGTIDEVSLRLSDERKPAPLGGGQGPLPISDGQAIPRSFVRYRDRPGEFDVAARLRDVRGVALRTDQPLRVAPDVASPQPLDVDLKWSDAAGPVISAGGGDGRAPRPLYEVWGTVAQLQPGTVLQLDDEGGARGIQYDAAGTVTKADLHFRGFDLTDRADVLDVEADALPGKLTLQSSPDGTIVGGASAPIGEVRLRLVDQSANAITPPPGKDGVSYVDTPQSFGVAARIGGVRSFELRTGSTQVVAVDSAAGKPFGARITMPQSGSPQPLRAEVDLAKLPPKARLSLEPRAGGGKLIGWSADAAVPSATMVVRDVRLTERARYAGLTVTDLPKQFTVATRDSGKLEMSAADPVGGVRLRLADSEANTIAPPVANDGATYVDEPAKFAVAVAIHGLRSFEVDPGTTQVVAADSVAGKPFEAVLRMPQADSDESLRGKLTLAALPPKARLSLAPNGKDGRLIQWSAGAPIASAQLTVRGVEITDRARFARLDVTDVPKAFTVKTSDRIEVSAADPIGRIEARMTEKESRLDQANLVSSRIPADEDGFDYVETAAEFYAVGRISGLRGLLLQPPKEQAEGEPERSVTVANVDAVAGRPFGVDFELPESEPGEYEASGKDHFFLSGRLAKLRPKTKLTVDVGASGDYDEQLADIEYQAQGSAPGLTLSSNAGGAKKLTVSTGALPEKLRACYSTYRWCATSDAYLIDKRIGRQPAGFPQPNGTRNDSGSIFVEASSPMTIQELTVCYKGATCTLADGNGMDGVIFQNLKLQKLAFDMSLDEYVTESLRLRGHIAVDTDGHPVNGLVHIRFGQNVTMDVNRLSYALNGLRADDRLALWHTASKGAFEKSPLNDYWAKGPIECNGGLILVDGGKLGKGLLMAQQITQIFNYALCENHPAP